MVGNIIKFSDIYNLPSRNDFVDKSEICTINKTIKEKKPLLFLPTYVCEMNLQDVKYQKAKYKIVLMGILQDGRKVSVIIDNVIPYFEVKLKNDPKEETKRILSILSKKNIIPDEYEFIEGKPFKYYQKNNSVFMRLYFNKLKPRSDSIKELRLAGFETATDDLTSYYKVVCRDNQTSFNTWISLTDYVYLKSIPCRKCPSNNTQEGIASVEESYLFDCTLDLCEKHKDNLQCLNIKGDIFRVNISNYKIAENIPKSLLKDKSLSCAWDIETYSKSRNLPKPEIPEDKIFCIGLTFQWINEPDTLVRYCLCDLEAVSYEGNDYTTIICENEYNIILAFSIIIGKMRPEFIMGFNDSEYDWPWVIKRATSNPGLLTKMANNMTCIIPFQQFTDKSVLDFKYRCEKTKLDAETTLDSCSLMLDGYVNIDVRIIFRKLYSKSEYSSLKWFLSENKLGGKEDMPFSRMFQIYEDYVNFMNQDERDPVKHTEFKNLLAEINNYCVIDAFRCHELIKIRSVIMDHREVSNLSYVSFYDAVYRANGMKVQNLTIGIGQKSPFNIRFTNISNNYNAELTEKYSGGFVLPPKKGLKVSKLSVKELIKRSELADSDNPNFKSNNMEANLAWKNITENEIKEFYKIISEYGPCPTEEEIRNIKSEVSTNKNITRDFPSHFIEFLKTNLDRPIVGLDFSSLYPSLIRCYNLSPEYCITNGRLAKELHDSGVPLIKVEFTYQGEDKIGYFIWHDNKLDITKPDFKFGVYPYILDTLFNKRASLKKEMKNLMHRKEIIDDMDELTEDLQTEYTDLTFDINCINSKQNALKVFMNTFYGVAGSKNSPFFILEVANGITSCGQRNIQLAYTVASKLGCNIYYGDTDSLYLSVPGKVFKEIDILYYTEKMTKLEYWTKLVEITFEEINYIRDTINEEFYKDNGTRFLSMAYEEVLWSCYFAAKKKYFAKAHEHIANFKTNSLFIRGMDAIKRGQCDLTREVFTELMQDICSMDNLLTPLELVKNKIDEIYSKKWSPDKFIKSAVYRTGKSGVYNTFGELQVSRGIDLKPNDRFKYVMIKKYPYKYDHRGCKHDISVAERMELLETFDSDTMEIDLDYYMQGGINGQLARLITYHEMFHVEPTHQTVGALKIAEENIYKNACKYIENYASKYYAKYNTVGRAYQKIFRSAEQLVKIASSTYDPLASSILNYNIDMENIKEWFEEHTETMADRYISEDYGGIFIEEEIKKMESLVRNLKDITDIDRKSKIQIRQYSLRILQEIYYHSGKKSFINTREEIYVNTMNILRDRLQSSCSEISKIFNIYKQGVENVTNIIKSKIDIQTILNPSDKKVDYTLSDLGIDIADYEDTMQMKAIDFTNNCFNNPDFKQKIDDIKKIYKEMISTHIYIKRTRSIVNYLKIQRDKVNGAIMRPDDKIMQKIINESVDELAANFI